MGAPPAHSEPSRLVPLSLEEWRSRAAASRALVRILALLELRVRRLVNILKVKFMLYLACPDESNLLGLDLLLVLASLQHNIDEEFKLSDSEPVDPAAHPPSNALGFAENEHKLTTKTAKINQTNKE